MNHWVHTRLTSMSSVTSFLLFPLKTTRNGDKAPRTWQIGTDFFYVCYAPFFSYHQKKNCIFGLAAWASEDSCSISCPITRIIFTTIQRRLRFSDAIVSGWKRLVTVFEEAHPTLLQRHFIFDPFLAWNKNIFKSAKIVKDPTMASFLSKFFPLMKFT